MVRTLVGSMLFLTAVSCGSGGGSPNAVAARAVPPNPSSPTASTRPAPASSPPQGAAPGSDASSNPPAEADGKPPPPSRHPSRSLCRGADLDFNDVYVKECALADVPAAKTPPSIALEIRPQRGYISGYPGALWVAFVNRSASEVDMVFEHRCLFWDPGNLFDLEATNDRGESAMLDVFRPKVGILGALDVDCPKPYVGAKVPAGGRITIGFFLDASALEQVGPGLPPGALAPGIYSVEVTTPLVQRPSLKGTFRMNVGVMRKE